MRAMLVGAAVLLGAGVLSGCGFSRANERLAQAPGARDWDGQVRLWPGVVQFDEDAVGQGVYVGFQRVGPDQWRSDRGGLVTVDGNVLRGPGGALARLEETEDGWRVTTSVHGPVGHFTLKRAETGAQRDGRTVVARMRGWGLRDAVSVEVEAPTQGLPWPQVGLALLLATAPREGDPLALHVPGQDSSRSPRLCVGMAHLDSSARALEGCGW